MNLKDTMLRDIRLYPSITKNKLDIYNHLFLTCGNAYEWSNGKLVYVYGDNKVPTIEEAIEKELLDEYKLNLFSSAINSYIGCYGENSPECKNQMEKFLKRYNENIQTILHAEHIINHDILINEDTIDFDFYPLTQYAAIMNIPNDIQTDWLEGIKELLNYLINSDLSKVVEYRTKFENELNQVIERIEKLKNNNGNNKEEN